MFLQILIIVVSAAMVIYGAERLTGGASSLARKLQMPEMVIGLTVVAFGTSMPEFCISLVAALNGSTDMAVGNVVGSNIANTMLIIGMTAAIAPIAITSGSLRKDMPFALMASVVLTLLCTDSLNIRLSGNVVSRLDGAFLLLLFALFLWYTLKTARTGKSSQDTTSTSQDTNHKKDISVWWVLPGLALLIGGSQLFTDAATALARDMQVSEGFVGLTIVALGTSLPELATSIVAAAHGRSALAIGNVIGSNVFNILWILGATAVICPLQIYGVQMSDLLIMVASMFILWFFAFTNHRVERWEGVVLTTLYVAYMVWLVA